MRVSTLIRNLSLAALTVSLAGCKNVTTEREKADAAAYGIIREKQDRDLGRVEPFSIERPSDLLRRRLIEEQGLPIADPASLGSDQMRRAARWSDGEFPVALPDGLSPVTEDIGRNTLHITLLDALQIAARNSREYQNRKEEIFDRALALELTRNDFRFLFSGGSNLAYTEDSPSNNRTAGVTSRSGVAVSRRFESGAVISSDLAVDLVKLLAGGSGSAFGISTDTTVTIPLLRGAGREIAGEPLLLAERDVTYALYDFERFRLQFVVSIASDYLGVLQQLDRVKNAQENFNRREESAERASSLSEAGRLPEIQVAQAIQQQLRASDQLLSAQQVYEQRLDNFKLNIGVPTDARIELVPDELARLLKDVELPEMEDGIEAPPRMEDIISEARAIELAFANRLDLKVIQNRVDDAQRNVMVMANRFLPELTLGGRAFIGEPRSLGTADLPDGSLRPGRGNYTALLNLDIPFNTTEERVAYRRSIINLESSVRRLQESEDRIKLEVRNGLRNLRQARESSLIQLASIDLAQRRVDSANLFLRAGRAEIRDLLDAQDSLIQAQNALTQALIDYRLAYLGLQRDIGLLAVDERGLWNEYDFASINN